MQGASVGLSGLLPASSLLHLALHHLRGAPQDPPRPSKRRRLDYNAEQARHVLILTSDQDALRRELLLEREVSIAGDTHHVETVRLLNRIEIKYVHAGSFRVWCGAVFVNRRMLSILSSRNLPTSAHLTYFLTTCYTHEHVLTSAVAFKGSAPQGTIDPSFLPRSPSLVLLHNPSAYLAEDVLQK